jgi:hypothetical protein
MSRKKWLIASLVGVSVIPSLFEILPYFLDMMPVPSSPAGVGTLKILLTVLWIDADSKLHPRVVRCFDYGFLVWIFWVPYFPWYLWHTRRVAGLLMYAGFLALLAAPDLTQFLIYVWFSSSS